MVILYEKNKFAKDLFTTKYRKRVVKPKKAKVVLKEKKKLFIQSSTYYLYNL